MRSTSGDREMNSKLPAATCFPSTSAVSDTLTGAKSSLGVASSSPFGSRFMDQRTCSGAAFSPRFGSDLPVTTHAGCSRAADSRPARNAATSASRAAAHSRPTRSLSRCRWLGLITSPASSRRSSLASLNDRALAACRTALLRAAGLYPSTPRPNLWSGGEKHDPTGRARELIAPQRDLATEAGEAPGRRRLGGVGLPPGRAAALGAEDFL